MFKKMVCAIMVVFLLCSGLCANAQAAPAVNKSAGGIVCYAAYTRSTSEKLSISAKSAPIRGSFTGYGTTTKVSIKAYLQKKSGTSWSDVTNWSQTFSASSGTLSKTKAVAAGTYRVKIVYTAYSGSKSEATTKYSTSVSC